MLQSQIVEELTDSPVEDLSDGWGLLPPADQTHLEGPRSVLRGLFILAQLIWTICILYGKKGGGAFQPPQVWKPHSREGGRDRIMTMRQTQW